jgi:glycosyltransferase involved in cell wall biosynthesis
MELLLVVISAAICVYLLFTILEITIGFNKIKNLTDQTMLSTLDMPKVSIILSALNEEVAIEQALSSLANQAYPNFEIIAINDRSTDSTPTILNRMQQQYANLHVYHIDILPDRWFGKNHALHFASQYATGDWLLFTDADVLMKPDALAKAISYAIENKIDHLTTYEYHQRKNFWLKVSLLGVYIAYSMVRKPWRIRYPWSKKSLGNGAFNLVKSSAYQHCNGHKAIAMECLDDMKLGELLKTNGFSQDTVNGQDHVEREWYGSMREMITGMQKNSFAYYNYKFIPMFRDCFLAFVFYLWPLLATILFPGVVRYFNMLNIFLMIFVSMYVAKQFRLPQKFGLLYPASMAILIYTVWNSFVFTYRNKGVVWRGTHYSLGMLKNIT